MCSHSVNFSLLDDVVLDCTHEIASWEAWCLHVGVFALTDVKAEVNTDKTGMHYPYLAQLRHFGRIFSVLQL